MDKFLLHPSVAAFRFLCRVKKHLRRMAPALWAWCLATQLLPAQTVPDSFRQIIALPVQAQFATTDHLGNVYLISRQNALEKYAPDGRLLTRYTNNRLGRASTIDVTNPLKVLVWYADFRTVLFLDRSLTMLGEINLIAAGFPEVRTVAAAPDGNLWLYDEVAFLVRKITPDGHTLWESQPLNLLLQERLSVACMRDNGNEVLASDPAKGILTFDTYGQFKKFYPRTGVGAFVLETNRIAYLSGNEISIESLDAMATKRFVIPPKLLVPETQYWLSPGALLVQEKENLRVFEILGY